MLDENLFKVAQDWAEKIYHDFLYSLENKEFCLKDEEKRIFQDLTDCKWFNKYPITDDKTEDFTREMLTITRYRYLRWRQEHESGGGKQKLSPKSKWEVVHGRIEK